MRGRSRGWRGAASAIALACASDGGNHPHPMRPAAALASDGPISLATSGLPMTGVAEPARVLAGAGLRAANAPCRLLRWSSGAPDARDRFDALDAWVRDLQREGYRDIEVCIELSGKPRTGALVAPRTPLPPTERQAQFAAWIG